MAPEELFSQLSLWMVNLCLKYFSFCIYFILYLHVWIRTYRAPEFESHTGPDPHPQCCRWLGNFANEKIKQAKNILFPWTATASPATIDFCINLDRDFESLVVDKLCKTSRDAFLQQLDPASMPDTVRTKTRREITHTLYGNILYRYIYRNQCCWAGSGRIRNLFPGSGIICSGSGSSKNERAVQ